MAYKNSFSKTLLKKGRLDSGRLRSVLLFFRKSFITALLKTAGKTPVWTEKFACCWIYLGENHNQGSSHHVMVAIWTMCHSWDSSAHLASTNHAHLVTRQFKSQFGSHSSPNCLFFMPDSPAFGL